jgi:glycopeptide antibiotics resistance protein
MPVIATKIGIEEVDVLLMNTEGAELGALKGAEEALKKVVKVIVACCGDIKDHIYNFLFPLRKEEIKKK